MSRLCVCVGVSVCWYRLSIESYLDVCMCVCVLVWALHGVTEGCVCVYAGISCAFSLH